MQYKYYTINEALSSVKELATNQLEILQPERIEEEYSEYEESWLCKKLRNGDLQTILNVLSNNLSRDIQKVSEQVRFCDRVLCHRVYGKPGPRLCDPESD